MGSHRHSLHAGLHTGRFHTRHFAAGLVGVVALAAAVAGAGAARALTITEIMYNPAGPDETLEYIELYNETKDPVDLGGFFFSRGIDFVFGERVFLEGGQYLVVCANQERVREVYGIENTIGDWNPETALANSGEAIQLSNSQGVAQVFVDYNDRGKWPGGVDGTGHSLEIRNPYLKLDNPESWSLSGVLGGSPGVANDTESGSLPVVINEALILTDDEPFLELFNAGDEEIDLSGFHLTNDPMNLTMVPLAAGTTLPAGGFRAFTAAELGFDFTLDENGRLFLALVRPEGDRVIDGRDFEARLHGFSEARLPDGGRRFADAADPTPGAANRQDVEDSVVINEIFYHHFDKDPRHEFVELYNRGQEAVNLSGWRFSDGISFIFPPDTHLAAGGYVVVARDPVFVREVYGLPDSMVHGPQTDEALEAMGVLADGGERVALADHLGREVDSVPYVDGGDWPEWADGEGASLELIDPLADNSVAHAWDASDDSDKAEVREYSYSGDYLSPGEEELHLLLNARGITLVDNIRMTTKTTFLRPSETYFERGSQWRYFKGTQAPPENWREPEFDDSAWLPGAAPLGFSTREEEYEGGTFLADMRRNYIAVFYRGEFVIENIEDFDTETLLLQVEFDDGFVAYINGVEVAQENMELDDGSRAYDGEASRTGGTRTSDTPVDFILNDYIGSVIRPGRNVITFQVHNTSITSNDYLFSANLMKGVFVTEEGLNLVMDGDFEGENPGGTPRWPSKYTNEFWTFEGNHVRSGRTEKEALDGAGSLRIVASGRGDNKVNRIETSNSGLGSLEARGTYSISFLAKWVAGTPSLLTHGAYNGNGSQSNYAASHQLHVPDNLGTPGAVNSVTLRHQARTGSTNLGPTVSGVEQTPVTPQEEEPVTVRARVSDPDGVAAVELRYTLGTPKEDADAEVMRVAMEDPDGDGVFDAVVPPQPLREIVIFWIVTEDASGATERFPPDNLARTHPLTLDSDDVVPADRRFLIYRHEPVSEDDSFLDYRLLLHEDNETFLRTRRLLSNDLLEGSFVFNNTIQHYNSRMRFAGSPWARGAFSSLRVRMPKDNPLWGRIEKFNTENHQGGGGRDGRERMSHYLIRQLDGIYSDQWLVRVQLNDRVRGTILEHVQTPSRELLELWYPGDDDGPFFEMDDRFVISDAGTRSSSTDGKLLAPPYGAKELGRDKEYYRYFFGSRGGNPYDDFTDLMDWAQIMDPQVTDDETFDEVIWDVADVEMLLRVWAIRLNTDDWDTWGANRGKNCYLYKPRIDGRWINIPWDCELTYASLSNFAPPPLTPSSDPRYTPGSLFPEVVRFMNRPRIKRIYYGILDRMTRDGGPFTREFLTPYAQLLQQAGVNPGNTINFVNSKRAALRRVVESVVTESLDFSIDTNGGAAITSDAPVVTIEGMAPVDVRRIVVLKDGQISEDPGDVIEAAFSDENVLGWRYDAELPNGTTNLTFVAYGFDDEELGTQTIEVTVSAAARFVRGDANSSGKLEVSDAIQTLLYVGGLTATGECQDAMDSDDNGMIDLTDAVAVLEYLFLQGPDLAPPFPGPGADPTADNLGCGTN